MLRRNGQKLKATAPSLEVTNHGLQLKRYIASGQLKFQADFLPQLKRCHNRSSHATDAHVEAVTLRHFRACHRHRERLVELETYQLSFSRPRLL